MKEKQLETPLDPKIKKIMQSLEEMPERDPATAHHRKEQFIKSIIDIRQQNVTFSKKQRLPIQRNLFHVWRNSMTIKIISIVLAVMIVLSGAGIGTVAASQNSLPDEALYSLKLWSENIRLDLTSNPEKLFDLQLELADRRFDEYIEMVEDGTVPPESLMQQYQQFLELAAQLSGELEDPLQSQQKIQNRMQNQQQQIEMVQPIDPLLDLVLQQAQQMLQEQLHLMDCEEGEECEFDRVQNQQQQIEMNQSIDPVLDLVPDPMPEPVLDPLLDPVLQQAQQMLQEQLHLMNCEEGEECEFESNLTLEQTYEQKQNYEDQPEGALSIQMQMTMEVDYP